MRIFVCIIAAALSLAARPGFAQPDRFWSHVQATCDATAARPAGDLGRRIAQAAIAEFDSFGGHKIDANGRLFRFGTTEAEHKPEGGDGERTDLGRLGWWHVLKYWRALYGFELGQFNDELEVRGYRDAAASKNSAQVAASFGVDLGPLLRATENIADTDQRETLREAVIRAAIIDTPWSAAFISYVIRHAGVAASAFQFANAHRLYIYDAFATSAADVEHQADSHLYRACPLTSTRPRVGDLICAQRDEALANTSAADVRARVRLEVAGGSEARSLRNTHCEVVAHVDRNARKVYTIGGNVLQSVTARKMNLRRDMKFSTAQSGHCGGGGAWTLPSSAAAAATCSLNGHNWFVLLQLR